MPVTSLQCPVMRRLRSLSSGSGFVRCAIGYADAARLVRWKCRECGYCDGHRSVLDGGRTGPCRRTAVSWAESAASLLSFCNAVALMKRRYVPRTWKSMTPAEFSIRLAIHGLFLLPRRSLSQMAPVGTWHGLIGPHGLTESSKMRCKVTRILPLL
jgi:hypothetical protein